MAFIGMASVYRLACAIMADFLFSVLLETLVLKLKAFLEVLCCNGDDVMNFFVFAFGRGR